MSILCLTLNSINLKNVFSPFLNTHRFKSMYRQDCLFHEPKCGKKKLEASKCMKELKEKKKAEKYQKLNPFSNFWEHPECDICDCPDATVRFDDLYYTISDKAKRKYQTTWHEFPHRIRQPINVCCYDQLDLPTGERRPRGKKELGTACEFQTACFRKEGECPRFVLPGCKKVRKPPDCFIIRKPTKCRKTCTPYPSYSECKQARANVPDPVECNCLEGQSLCTLYELMRNGHIKLQKGKKLIRG